ncbi:MAG: EamA family transporter [Eubacteriales bacterium]|nr:EamA family transporter [Eubacteriales bacterium]
MNKKASIKNLTLLNISFLIYSFAGVLSKKASSYEYFSFDFIKYFMCAVFIIILYSIIWQLSLQRIPLSIAYSNKATTMIWGLIWSILIFHEDLRAGIIVGGCLIIAGILLVVNEDE